MDSEWATAALDGLGVQLSSASIGGGRHWGPRPNSLCLEGGLPDVAALLLHAEEQAILRERDSLRTVAPSKSSTGALREDAARALRGQRAACSRDRVSASTRSDCVALRHKVDSSPCGDHTCSSSTDRSSVSATAHPIAREMARDLRARVTTYCLGSSTISRPRRLPSTSRISRRSL